jgi:hypothetical protein
LPRYWDSDHETNTTHDEQEPPREKVCRTRRLREKRITSEQKGSPEREVVVVVVEEEEGVPLICIRFVNEGVRITRLSEGDLRHEMTIIVIFGQKIRNTLLPVHTV